MGEVYRARDPRLSREVAVKVLPASLSADPDRLRRFEQEARAAGVLNHPNITAVYDIGQHEGSPYVVSELLEGETLRSRLGGEALSLRKALDYARQIALGLAAAHEKGIVHRDLKPENLFVTRDGRVKILDFGLAKLTRAEEGGARTDLPTAAAGTEPGMVLGTLGYMSPEQVRGRPADHRSDIFSFGAILYEMLSGKRAFYRDTAADTMSAILKEDPPDLSVTGKNIPPGLERIVRHCLEKNPEERFHSAHDLAFDLQALSDHSGIAVSPRLQRSRLRFSSTTLVSGAVLLAAGAVLGAWLGGWLLRRPIPEPPSFRYLTYSGDDWSPAASPDGTTIAFASSRDGTSRIWIKQLAGGNEVALTRGPDDSPRFWPDGSSVLFVRRNGERSALYRVSTVGGEPRRLVDDGWDPEPSPDGRRLAFLRSVPRPSGRATTLWLAEPDGSAPRQIQAFSASNLEDVCWSPDGRWIAALEQDLGRSVVPPKFHFIEVDGKKRRSLSPPKRKGLIGRATWDASGDALLYSHVDVVSETALNGASRLVRQEIESEQAATLFSFPSAIGGFDVLGDQRIVFHADTSREILREISLLPAASSAGRWLTRGNATDRQPVYSPDGEWVVFSSVREGNYDLWQVSTKTGSLLRLTDSPGDDWDPAVTRDGRKLIWSSNRTGNFEIWAAERDGSSPRQVSRDGVDAENPTGTPDGSWIVYDSRNPAKAGLWKIQSNGTGAIRLVEGETIHPEVSPDGRLALYFSGRGEGEGTQCLRVVSLEGAIVPFEICGLARRRARWVGDGRRIAFLDQDGSEKIGLFVQDFTPGRDTRATRRALASLNSDFEAESFGISADGARATLAETEWGGAILLAEGVPGLAMPERKSR
jgi:serine/threonine protein kinase